MVTILLEKILSVLEGWSASFASFIIDLMTKLNLIETETANLPDIKTNTDNISSNTDSMTATLTNIKTDTGSISGKVNNIDSNTTIIKNNINTISTNVGTASAFCEDTANNTLEIVDKITTIASDTTQIRTDSDYITTELHYIRTYLGYYLMTIIVTEDAYGVIANFDTDLSDYLEKAVVTIPSNANGISTLEIDNCGDNKVKDISWVEGYFIAQDGTITYAAVNMYSDLITVNENSNYLISLHNTYEGISTNKRIHGYDSNGDWVQQIDVISCNKDKFYSKVVTIPSGIKYIRISCRIDDEDIGVYKDYNVNNISFNSITVGAEINLLTGIITINTSPVTYDSITPIAIRTFKGVNNIYSDIGDMSVTYRETLKHYLEKQNS